MRRPVATALLLAASACAPADGTDGGAPGDAATHGVRLGSLEILNVVAPAPPPVLEADSSSTVAAYFEVRNRGTTPDTLYRVESPDGRASMHDVEARGGRQVMVPILSAVVPADSAMRFSPGRRHVMIEGVRRPLAPGDTLAITLYFRIAGSLALPARVVSYADVESALGPDSAHAGH